MTLLNQSTEDSLDQIPIEDDLTRLPEYRILENYYFKNKPHVFDQSSVLTTASLSYYDQFYWRPLDLYYREEIRKGSRQGADPFMIFHSSCHHLIASAFESKLMGRPRFVLLCEALVSLLDLYFLSRIIQVHGIESLNRNAARRFVQSIELGAQRVGKSESSDGELLDLILQCSASPFITYKEAVGQMGFVYKKLFAVALDRKHGIPTDLENLHRELDQLRYIKPIFSFMLTSNVAYALAFCGDTSDDSDHRDVVVLEKMLSGSENIEQFWQSLLAMAG